MPREMFIRFVVHEFDPDSGRRRGFLHAAIDLLDSNALDADDSAQLQREVDWICALLPRPARLARSTRSGAMAVALSWFRCSAVEAVSRARAACRLLRENGVATDEVLTHRPGYVVYEDEHQVTAEPFADTPT